MKFSRRSSRVKILKFSNVSETQSVLREEQGDGSVVHITYAVISGITPPRAPGAWFLFLGGLGLVLQ
jgi:hypothetical protein